MTPQYLGGDVADCQGRDPREMLAHWLTSRDNKGFARTLANRAWAQFFGRGIIEPVDDARISNPPSNEELLAALARRLVESDFNMRQLVRDICLSRTYQLSSSASESNAADDRYFSRSYVRRLQAEVLMDTIGKVTGSGTQLSGQMPGTRAVQLFDGGADKEGFLRNFGASKRETVCACEVRTEPTLTQTLALINGGTLDGALQRSPFLNDQGSAATPPPPEQVIEEIFLRALARKPTDPERSRMLDAAGAVNMSDKTARRRFYEDILWGVMNSTEFAFNH
jgi:AraC-like DNA-binding protein